MAYVGEKESRTDSVGSVGSGEVVAREHGFRVLEKAVTDETFELRLIEGVEKVLGGRRETGSTSSSDGKSVDGVTKERDRKVDMRRAVGVEVDVVDSLAREAGLLEHLSEDAEVLPEFELRDGRVA
jgi:hypothetical protein